MTEYSIDRKKLKKKDRKLNKWRHKRKFFKQLGTGQREEVMNRDRELDRWRRRKKFLKVTGYKKHRKIKK